MSSSEIKGTTQRLTLREPRDPPSSKQILMIRMGFAGRSNAAARRRSREIRVAEGRY